MTTPSELETSTRDQRLAYWRRRLGRIRLGVEPVTDQLERIRRVTVALTVIPAVLAAMFLALFSAFRRPDIGLVVAAVLCAPVPALAWADFARLRRAVAEYLREQEAGAKGTPGEAGSPPPAS